MDYNDILFRLKRTFTSLDARFDYNPTEAVIFVPDLTRGPGVIKLKIGDDDEATLYNKIFTILHNLASLKDHLKKCLKDKGKDSQIVETEINNSLHLQVLIDLVNQEKHRYPLTKSNRSGKNPLIRGVKEVIALSPGTGPDSWAFFTPNENLDGLIFDVKGTGKARTEIFALIYDDKNNLLFTLNELVEICYQKWDTLAKTYQCV